MLSSDMGLVHMGHSTMIFLSGEGWGSGPLLVGSRNRFAVGLGVVDAGFCSVVVSGAASFIPFLIHPSRLFFCFPAWFVFPVFCCGTFGSGSAIFSHVPPHSTSCRANHASPFPGGRFMARFTRPKWGGFWRQIPEHCQICVR